MRKGYILASFDVIMLILRLIYAFRENLRVLMKKIAFRRIQEKNRDSRKPRAPRITSRGKQGKARTCDGGARPGKSRQPASEMARPNCARQHDRAAQRGLAVLGGTAVPLCTHWRCFLARLCRVRVRRGLKDFRDFCRGSLPLSLFLLLERDLRESFRF